VGLSIKAVAMTKISEVVTKTKKMYCLIDLSHTKKEIRIIKGRQRRNKNQGKLFKK
jgi:hypothetical protein